MEFYSKVAGKCQSGCGDICDLDISYLPVIAMVTRLPTSDRNGC